VETFSFGNPSPVPADLVFIQPATRVETFRVEMADDVSSPPPP